MTTAEAKRLLEELDGQAVFVPEADYFRRHDELMRVIAADPREQDAYTRLWRLAHGPTVEEQVDALSRAALAPAPKDAGFVSQSVRDAATRSLVADLATLYRTSEFSHDTITRRLIDPLPLPKAIVTIVLLHVMPVGRRRPVWAAPVILDELARRRVAPATLRRAHG
jgi:hypothetical protein